MALADHIKLKPNPELELMLEIKYGKPRSDEDYLDKLPRPVFEQIRADLCSTHPYAKTWADEDLRQVIANLIDWSPERIAPVITKALFTYHSLLGHV